MKPISAIYRSLAALVLLCGAADANENCGPRDDVVQRLEARFGETRRSIGLTPNNTLVEIFANLQRGSWTIIATTPNGVSCFVASGSAFETRDIVLSETKTGL